MTGDGTRGGPGTPEEPGGRLVTVARCPTTAVADFARSLLDQAGIESVLQDQYVSQMFPFFTAPIGGVRVQVRLRDVPAALEALRHPPRPLAADVDPGFSEGAEGAESLALRCPECGSDSISFQPAEPEGFLIHWLERVIPLPFLHGHWECGSCGKHWLELTAPRR